MTIQVGIGCEPIRPETCLSMTVAQRKKLRSDLGIKDPMNVLEKKVDKLFLMVGMWKDRGGATLHIEKILWENLTPVAEETSININLLLEYTRKIIELGNTICK